MKYLFLLSALLVATVQPAWAQLPIYRCGNEYTNTRPDAHARGCKLIEAGNITVVPGTKVSKPATANKASPSPGNESGTSNRIASADQKARDSDARQILQAELKKALARHEELQKDYNSGTPEKRGDEVRNHQKYLDRVAELKASLARNESDMAGIRRELERLPGDATATR